MFFTQLQQDKIKATIILLQSEKLSLIFLVIYAETCVWSHNAKKQVIRWDESDVNDKKRPQQYFILRIVGEY